MLRTRLYYSAKPFLPCKLRMALRRWHAKRILRRCGDVWPILESAGRKPDGWPGWPDGKQFALVLQRGGYPMPPDQTGVSTRGATAGSSRRTSSSGPDQVLRITSWLRRELR
ncbi:MAG: hypothetical protein M5U12_08940 [Verrucomicrobia bacterium]|nr:hypothetical protein [Verrucomicrobiota bacterium]